MMSGLHFLGEVRSFSSYYFYLCISNLILQVLINRRHLCRTQSLHTPQQGLKHVHVQWFIWLWAPARRGPCLSSSASYTNTMPHSTDGHTAFRFSFFYYRFTHTVGTHPHTYVYTQPLMHLQIQTVTQRHAFAHVFKTSASSSLSSIHVQMRFHGSIVSSYFYFILMLWSTYKNRIISSLTR